MARCSIGRQTRLRGAGLGSALDRIGPLGKLPQNYRPPSQEPPPMNATKFDLRPVAKNSACIKAIKAKALAAYERITPRIVRMREAGFTPAEIAAIPNEAGETARKGSKFHGDTVRRILRRVRSSVG
jgi:hypothetical protein